MALDGHWGFDLAVAPIFLHDRKDSLPHLHADIASGLLNLVPYLPAQSGREWLFQEALVLHLGGECFRAAGSSTAASLTSNLIRSRDSKVKSRNLGARAAKQPERQPELQLTDLEIPRVASSAQTATQTLPQPTERAHAPRIWRGQGVGSRRGGKEMGRRTLVGRAGGR